MRRDTSKWLRTATLSGFCASYYINKYVLINEEGQVGAAKSIPAPYRAHTKIYKSITTLNPTKLNQTCPDMGRSAVWPNQLPSLYETRDILGSEIVDLCWALALLAVADVVAVLETQEIFAGTSRWSCIINRELNSMFWGLTTGYRILWQRTSWIDNRPVTQEQDHLCGLDFPYCFVYSLAFACSVPVGIALQYNSFWFSNSNITLQKRGKFPSKIRRLPINCGPCQSLPKEVW